MSLSHSPDFLYGSEEINDTVKFFANLHILLRCINIFEHLLNLLSRAARLLLWKLSLRSVQLVFFIQLSNRLVTIDSKKVFLPEFKVLSKVLTPRTELIRVIVRRTAIFLIVLIDQTERLLQYHPFLELLIDHKLG